MSMKGTGHVTIDWINFSPLSALVGGLMIGVAATAFIVLHGRIMGVSSILGGLIVASKGDRLWRLSFFAGLLAAPLVGRYFDYLPARHITTPSVVLVLAGLLVGFGTGLGNGCTSGHGVCGIARLSLRSLTATLTFMIFGMFAVYFARMIGWSP